MWIGESGKRYDFAVCRPGTIRMDEPAVYILARHEGDATTPLFVGSLHRHFGLASERCPEEWRRALAMGMTHVHLRFDNSGNVRRAFGLHRSGASWREHDDQEDRQRAPYSGGRTGAAIDQGVGKDTDCDALIRQARGQQPNR